MLQIQRLTLVWITVIIFLATAPWLAFYAIGYDIDIINTDLINSLTIDAETGPDRAEIRVQGDFGTKSEYSNTSFRIPAGQFSKVQMKKEGYITDTFFVYGQRDTNSLARLQKVNLLPTASNNLGQLNLEWKDIDFVSKDLFIFKNYELSENGTWQIQQYGINGLYGSPQTLRFKSDLVSETYLVNSDQNFKVSVNNYWEPVTEESFWNQTLQSLLFKQNGAWTIWQADKLEAGKAKVVEVDNNNLLIHLPESNGSLYLLNLDTNQLRFIEGGVIDLDSTTDSIWYLTTEGLFKAPKVIDNFTNQISSTIQFNYLNSSILNDLNQVTSENSNMKSYNIFQGVVIKINSQLYYKPDASPDNWKLLASNVRDFKFNRNSIFWFDYEGSFRNLNLELNERVLLGKPEFKQDITRLVDFVYYPEWHRYVFYYLPEDSDELSVSSLWFNPDLIQNSISTYSWVNWFSNMKDCNLQIQTGFQVCLNANNNLITYNNRF